MVSISRLTLSIPCDEFTWWIKFRKLENFSRDSKRTKVESCSRWLDSVSQHNWYYYPLALFVMDYQWQLIMRIMKHITTSIKVDVIREGNLVASWKLKINEFGRRVDRLISSKTYCLSMNCSFFLVLKMRVQRKTYFCSCISKPDQTWESHSDFVRNHLHCSTSVRKIRYAMRSVLILLIPNQSSATWFHVA